MFFRRFFKLLSPVTVLGLIAFTGTGCQKHQSNQSPGFYQHLSKARIRLESLSDSEFRAQFSFRDSKGNLRSTIDWVQNNPVKSTPLDWALKDPGLNHLEGTSTERALAEFAITPDPTAKPVIVAIIDNGVDITHPDLNSSLWTNEAEANGLPGVDDDGDGYIDDVHGWNFLGGANGKNITGAPFENTRTLAGLLKKKKQGPLTPEETALFEKVQNIYDLSIASHQLRLTRALKSLEELKDAFTILRRDAGLTEETADAVRAIQSDDGIVTEARQIALQYLNRGVNVEKLQAAVELSREPFNTWFNLNFDYAATTGEDPDSLEDSRYGNPDVGYGDMGHGTHVAGIVRSQFPAVQLLPVRAVPDGDERDKDIANAIRYSVDRGARILSMSFGKELSPNSELVAAAIRYAGSKGALLIHAAGNDSDNIDEQLYFPKVPLLPNGANEVPWLEVGASTDRAGNGLCANFSNYGPRRVDLFAPGEDIRSTIPGGGYGEKSGTSMAAPEVSGVAALLWSRFPDKSAFEIRQLLVASVRTYPGLRVYLPKISEPVEFSRLSRSGGIISAWNALRLGYGLSF